jgi:hypothetical protein
LQDSRLDYQAGLDLIYTKTTALSLDQFHFDAGMDECFAVEKLYSPVNENSQ